MRWERLFAEIEGQADDLALAERDALVAELRDGDWAETSWRSLLGGTVRLDVRGAGPLEGEVLLVNDRLVHLQADRVDHVVATAAVQAVLAAHGRSATPSSVGARLGWGHVLRAARDDAEEVRLTRMDGTTHEGRVDVVGQDFVRVASDGGRLVVVPFAALAVASVRR